MSDSISIPDDMIDREASKQCGGTVVSIRDFLVALCATDEELRRHDKYERLSNEILKREPWRDQRREVVLKEHPNGSKSIVIEGDIDWTGTELEGWCE